MPAIARLPQMAHDSIGIVLKRGCDSRISVSAILGNSGGTLLRVGHIRFHLQPIQGKVDGRVEFLRGLGLRRGKALEMDDEDFRKPSQCDTFSGFALTLAVRALPDFIPGEHFLLAIAA